MGIAEEVTVKGVEFKFIRRIYGSAGHHKTFTWLHYKDENDRWQEYPIDPWPTRKVPQEDLEKIAEKLKASVAPEIEMCEVCEMFDVQVLRDYWLGTDEHPETGHEMWALGQKAEPAAGLCSFYMTPWFETQEKLYDFCRRHIGDFKDYFHRNPEGPAPDATLWV